MARSKISFSLEIFDLAPNLDIFFDLWALWVLPLSIFGEIQEFGPCAQRAEFLVVLNQSHGSHQHSCALLLAYVLPPLSACSVMIADENHGTCSACSHAEHDSPLLARVASGVEKTITIERLENFKLSLAIFNPARKLQSRLNISILTLTTPHKNRGLVGGLLEMFNLA